MCTLYFINVHALCAARVRSPLATRLYWESAALRANVAGRIWNRLSPAFWDIMPWYGTMVWDIMPRYSI